jgi:hypothetical protein
MFGIRLILKKKRGVIEKLGNKPVTKHKDLTLYPRFFYTKIEKISDGLIN